ncbi:MAG: ComF family protein [Patescibacteria group bacterium]|jgi:ComF family protein
MKDKLLDIIFPLECLGCGRENEWFCQECFSLLSFKPEQSCPFCRRPNNDGATCYHCQKEKFLDTCLTAGDYNDQLLSRLIKTCKYSFAKDLIPTIGDFTFSFLQKNSSLINFDDNLFFIPIPLHIKRLNWRGFNQSELLAQYLAEKLKIKILPGLTRTKNNPPQAKFEEEKRQLNILDCFSWSGENLTGKKIILIDDVATTGATLNEAARILKKSGAKKVSAITAAGG